MLRNSVAKAIAVLCANHTFNQNVMSPCIESMIEALQNIDVTTTHSKMDYVQV
jgi:hypothetical protein